MPTRGIVLAKGRPLLFLATGEQRLLRLLRTHMQHTTGRLRAGTLASARASGAGGVGKDDLNAVWIMQGRPATTLLPLRTGGTGGLPVDLEVGRIEAVARFGLPAVVGQDGTHQRDARVLPAADQQLDIDIAGIQELFLRQPVHLGQCLLLAL